MTHFEVRCRCGGRVETQPLDEVPPPPGALFATIGPSSEWKGWLLSCSACGAECGVTYDYGELDLGIVRDSQLRDREDDFEILG